MQSNLCQFSLIEIENPFSPVYPGQCRRTGRRLSGTLSRTNQHQQTRWHTCSCHLAAHPSEVFASGKLTPDKPRCTALYTCNQFIIVPLGFWDWRRLHRRTPLLALIAFPCLHFSRDDARLLSRSRTSSWS